MTKVVTAKYDKYITRTVTARLLAGVNQRTPPGGHVLAEGRLKYSTGDIIYRWRHADPGAVMIATVAAGLLEQ